jgi:type IV secretory pathway protease TraF
MLRGSKKPMMKKIAARKDNYLDITLNRVQTGGAAI